MKSLNTPEQTPSVLILDEDQEMRELMSTEIRGLEYTLLQAETFSHALTLLATNRVSVFILNFKIPEISITDLMKRVRMIAPLGTLSVLVLTNPGQPREIEKALLAGVNDVLARPFNGADLSAKLKALIKTGHPGLKQSSERNGRLSYQSLVIDIHSHDVFSADVRVKLTPNEFKLLHALLERPGQILSRDRLIELVQGEGVAVVDRAVDTHVFSLRKKLGEVGSAIETVRGEGYRIGDAKATLSVPQTLSGLTSEPMA